jgi:hypothetical protein
MCFLKVNIVLLLYISLQRLQGKTIERKQIKEVTETGCQLFKYPVGLIGPRCVCVHGIYIKKQEYYKTLNCKVLLTWPSDCL